MKKLKNDLTATWIGRRIAVIAAFLQAERNSMGQMRCFGGGGRGARLANDNGQLTAEEVVDVCVCVGDELAGG